jgi:hypothetical protein
MPYKTHNEKEHKMPSFFSMTAVLFIFYVIFLSQIFVMSLYYPRKIAGRIRYVLDNFPPEEFPKLYPTANQGFVADAYTKLGLYLGVNYAIATVGLTLVVLMWATGYKPDPKGGDEIFVMIYFSLQVAPLVVISMKEFKQYRRMNDAFMRPTRSASLQPRRLSDFVSPTYVILAAILYVGWLAFYLSGLDPIAPWGGEVYASVGLITAMNVAYIGIIARFMFGKKVDPYKSHKDQLKQIESIVKALVLSSIGCSLFLTMTIAADRYALEVFDPPLASLYLQLCLIFGVGLTMRTDKVEAIDFDVYRENTSAT